MRLHVKKGDKVEAIAGKEKGRSGKVLEIDGRSGRARVEGLMLVKRHLKKGRSQTVPEGGIIEKFGTIDLSNLMVVCPKCNKASRTGMRTLEDGRRVRFCQSCQETID